MSQTIKLTASDGVTIDAYRADPVGKARGGLVVVQEIFGVNSHIRRVADGFAAEGFLVIAPALFDRVRPGIELAYTQDDIREGSGLVGQIEAGKPLLDIAAAVKVASEAGKVGIVGYCWGGTLSFLAGCEVEGLSAAVAYYGGGIAGQLAHKPKVPLLMHFGAKDKHIPLSDVDTIRAALPGVPVHVYEADHGFNCDARGSYDKPSAAAALDRTLAFLHQHVG